MKAHPVPPTSVITTTSSSIRNSIHYYYPSLAPLLFVLLLLLLPPPPSLLQIDGIGAAAAAAPPVTSGMRSIGNAVKQYGLEAGVETTFFEHTLSSSSAAVTHGAITQQWHAGEGNSNLRVRVYVDNETVASVDYPVALAHGLGPKQTDIPQAWGAELLGHSSHSGFYNTFLIPFGKSVRVTLTMPPAASKRTAVWYMVRGMENAPLVVSGLSLPISTRVRARAESQTVPVGTTVKLVETGNGAPGLLHAAALVINGTYKYQEGCISAQIDSSDSAPEGLWISSGLEDYALSAYFHSAPASHLPYSGFMLGAVDEPAGLNNAVSMYRVHEKDPILFTDSLTVRWQASSDNGAKNGGWCNYNAWPPADFPKQNHPPLPGNQSLSVNVLTWVYSWSS